MNDDFRTGMKDCSGCWFWSEGPNANNSGAEFGECRRKSPRRKGFPRTRYDVWCAKWASAGFMPKWPKSSK